MRIGVLGAGAIGCMLGGRLRGAGHDVVLLGRRPNPFAGGLLLTDYLGGRVALPPEQVVYRTDPGALGDREVILVTVKSTATESAARPLAPRIGPGTLVVSFQNGVGNADVLRQALPGVRVLAGMVPFNVLRRGDGHFHRGTSGPLAIEEAAGVEQPLAGALRQAGFEVEVHAEIARILWSKLLLNLNNPLNALAGVPLHDQIRDRGYRRVLARCIGEGLRCLRAAGIRPARIGRMVPRLGPLVLSLPNALFRRVAAAMVDIDPLARSSMWEDLERRAPTEIDFLSGEIVRLGERHGVPVPVNRRIGELVRAAEAAAQGSPRLSSAALLREIGG